MGTLTMVVLDPLTADQRALWPGTPVSLATLSTEAAPGLVGVMERGVVFQIVSVSIMNSVLFNSVLFVHTVNCPDLLPLANGMIMYSPAGSPGNRPFLSSAVHSCNPGYTLTGGTLIAGTSRFCLTGGRWGGSPPTCQGELCSCYVVMLYTANAGPTYCSDLPPLTNGMIMYIAGSTNNRPVNTGAIYSCNIGYTLTGDNDALRLCLVGVSWSGSALTCQCNYYALRLSRTRDTVKLSLCVSVFQL